MRIAIVTFHSSQNYGAVLQCYALQTVLIEMGHDIEIIDRLFDKFNIPSYRFKRVKKVIFPNYFERFREKFLKLSEHINSQQDLYDIQIRYDVIITGSDQIWNFDCIKKMGYYYYLDWVTSLNVRKISYAVSFGKDAFELSDEVKKKVTGCLKGFSSISVREKSGIDICQNMLGLKADYDLDPTLLLSADDYNSIVKLDMRKRKKILCSFILDQSEEKKTYVKTIAAKLGLEVVNIYPEDVNRWKAMVSSKYGFLPVEKWLKYIYNADFVVTDSFHGVAFSINFNKQFVAINNIERGSTRFVNLLTLLNIKDRLIDNFDLNCIERKINYAEVNRLLALEKERSYYRLLNMIKY